MIHITCGNRTPVIPKNGCSDCEQLEERVEALEQCCEDVNAALDEKADESEVQEIINIIHGLGASWHYVGDIADVSELPESITEGDAYYDVSTGSWYIAKEDVPSGATIDNFFFVSGNDYTLHTDTVNGDAVLQLQDSHNHTSNVPVVGEGAVNVEDTGDELTISVENATTEQAGLMSPEDKDKLDNIDDIYDETCGDPAEFEGQGGANLKSVQVALEPHQAGTPWQDSTLYKTPFLFGRTPSVNHSINSKYTTLVGADVAVNQLLSTMTSGNVNVTGGTKSVSDGVATFRAAASGNQLWRYYPSGMVVGHKCLCAVTFKTTTATALVGMKLQNFDPIYGTASTSWQTVYKLFNYEYSSSIGVIDNRTSDWDDILVKDFMFIDLTQMLGTSIADTAYTKEQATAGSGIAWLKANGFDFSKYRAYNAGSLESVNPSAIVDRGFNQWDEQWENGRINVNTGVDSPYTNGVKSKNFIPIIPDTTYYAKSGAYTGGSSITLYYYDYDKNYLSYANYPLNGTFVSPSNASYMRFCIMTSAAVTTYNHDICINLHYDGSRDGEYEQYIEHEYALGNVPLHGVFKEENGNIVAYGDVRTSDGTVNRKFATETYDGDEAWSVEAQQIDGFYRYWVQQNALKKTNDYRGVIIASACVTGVNYVNGTGITGEDMVVTGYSGGGASNWIYIFSKSLTTVESFKAWLSNNPITVTYELATPTTDTADPFTSPQVVDSWGTEEFVTSNDVPVGNQTRYADVYEITGTDEVTVTVADDPDNPTTSDDYTTDLGQIVYEGTVDVVSGKLTVTMASIESYNGETINEPWLSSLDPYVAGTTPTTGAHVVYTLDTPIEIDLTPNEIEALLGDNYVWSEQGSICVTFMRDRGELSETLAELQECCDSCDSSECESDLVVFQHISADVSDRYPLDSLLPGDDVLYKITVNGNTVIKESAVYDGMWLWSVDNNIELFYDEDDGWMVMANSGEYDIKVETVCNQPLYVNLSASPLDSTQEIVMDKTFKEIEDAYKLGKTVIVRYSNYQHYTPLQVCYDPYTGFFVSIHGYDKATSTFDIFTFLAVLDNDYPTYYAIV